VTRDARYDPEPRYPAAGGEVERGLPPLPEGVLAIDGPAALAWDVLIAQLPCDRVVDVRGFTRPWPEAEPADPAFARAPDGSLADLVGELPPLDRSAIVIGPGSALAAHDELWYVDLPKRHALDAVKRGEAPNLGGGRGAKGSERLLVYVDWPLQDRHKEQLVARLDHYVDFSDPALPRRLSGAALRSTLTALARRPFRTRPTFLPGPWGGQWLRTRLAIDAAGPNIAWSYELVAPEAGILVDSLEVGLELLLAQEGPRVLGEAVAARFGASFPIRFDYLDTVGGGHLSIQCHPREDYMADVFGLPYTQLESYYVMETTPGATVFLGLRDNADVEAFEGDARAALGGEAFEPERYLQAHSAEPHRLYLIPAGTVHASGAGNLVLEISATPYLYTLRFYDWLRRDLDERLRPVHLDHAFANLDPARRGDAVTRDLIQEPRIVRSGDGWAELQLGRLPELFFAVHRLDFDHEVADQTDGRFHVLNLVDGDEVTIETEAGVTHRLAYAETIVVPAAVGAYRLRGRGKAVKAFVV
jgi:mannose-6-phosphate isomerase class I